MNKDLIIYVNDASDSRKCQHLFLRGNFRQEMFYDLVDMVNVWNRIWLSAKATGVQILSVSIMHNHFHLTSIFQDDKQRAAFKHHLRLSITQYHNRRYQVHGTVGTRTLKQASLKGLEDIKDCICYHIRNVRHHGITSDFLDYQFSTARHVFGLANDKQKGIYTRENIPQKMTAYLPIREQMPKGWFMTEQGMIVPPPEVFRADIVEALFNSREEYLETLSHRTSREAEDRDEPKVVNYASDSRKCQDEQVVEFVKESCRIPIPSMTVQQKMEAIRMVMEEYPKVSHKLLTRVFGIPYTTLRYRLRAMRD